MGKGIKAIFKIKLNKVKNKFKKPKLQLPEHEAEMRNPVATGSQAPWHTAPSSSISATATSSVCSKGVTQSQCEECPKLMDMVSKLLASGREQKVELDDAYARIEILTGKGDKDDGKGKGWKARLYRLWSCYKHLAIGTCGAVLIVIGACTGNVPVACLGAGITIGTLLTAI